MKKFALILLGLALCLESLAGGVKSGPWVSEARADCVTILWTSEVPGMAYVELADGTKIWETFAYKDIPLGFAKNIGTRANNMYPQEWRIRNSIS